VPATPLLELSAGDLHVQIAPAIGGSISRFYGDFRAGAAQGEVEWLRPASAAGLAASDPLAMASFPLVPFCNRIRDGRATFEGREIRFPPNHPAQDSPHPLHGIGWQRPWKVALEAPAHASLTIEVPATDAWPWSFSARQDITLTAQQLEVVITLTNLDAAAMPAGIGHHPYFPHTPGTRLTTHTRAMWEADKEVMPTALRETQAVRDLRAGVALSHLDLDNNFTGWERTALIEWPADSQGPARSLAMEAQAPLDYFVLYCPSGADHFCAEPVSQCTDWLNLLPVHGQKAVGGARVPPGESAQGRFTLKPTLHAR
jgi:aldose 1-epimerase